MTTERATIEQIATDVLAALDLHTLPIDPLQIAATESIRLAPGDYDGCFDSRIEYHRRGEKGLFYLFYDESVERWRPETRIRFSIGHELGHFYLGEHRKYLLSGRWHGSRCEFVSDNPTEREADFFSASLLMPRSPFENLVRQKSQGVCNLKDLSSIANTCRTSLLSTALRYVQLDIEACSLILARNGVILWHFPSEQMKPKRMSWIPGGSRIPPGSRTGRFLASAALDDSEQSVSEGRIDSEVWYEKAVPDKLWEEAKVFGKTGLTLTYLVPEPSEDEEEV